MSGTAEGHQMCNPKIENDLPTAVAPSPSCVELPADVTANILQRGRHTRRSTALKRLTLKDCYGLTEKAVGEAVNKRPYLEELHLIQYPEIEASDIVNIGNACPVLKSFTSSQYLYKLDPRFIYQHSKGNECALAIAKSMSNLRHLRLNSNLITNEGLEAILDGCPNLESLDLFSCSELDLGGALGKRCSNFMSTIYKISLQEVDLTDILAALDLIESDEEYSL